MEDIRPVSVADILAARDARAARQEALLREYRTPLISFTMNIAGPVKVDAAIRRAFTEGTALIRRELDRMALPVLTSEERFAFTGCEALLAVAGNAAAIKQRMCAIEESCSLGRLFDIDVIDADGRHLSRESERPCLICGKPVRACARSRAHSAAELFRKAHDIIEAHFQRQRVRRIAEWAQLALLHEALTTPKPGLVDCANSGAHQDMDLFSFAASACALRGYFEDCAALGMENAAPAQLQHAGRLAEDAMYRAANANTHKGAIFSLGILCYAAGACGEYAALPDILSKAAELGMHYLQQMLDMNPGHTGGEKQHLQYGLTGARGEAASGFKTVAEIALPALDTALSAGKALPKAGLDVLLRLIARVQDSNIIRRAGMEGQRWASAQAQRLLDNGYASADLDELDEAFIQRNISPGGSADLLAVTYFLHFIRKAGGDTP